MAINHTPIIMLTTNGDSVQVNVQALKGPGGSIVDATSALQVAPSAALAIATIATHPSDPRAVIITPGSAPGSMSLFVSESPSADVNLQVDIEVVEPPALREIVYVGHGPVVP